MSLLDWLLGARHDDGVHEAAVELADAQEGLVDVLAKTISVLCDVLEQRPIDEDLMEKAAWMGRNVSAVVYSGRKASRHEGD